VKVLLDTNIILDIWLAREPFWRDSALLLGRIENKELEGYICPTTVTTLHYIGKKVLGEKNTRDLITRLIEVCQVGEMSESVFRLALGSKITDFEDAVIESVAISCGVDLIATRNTKDFKNARISAIEPYQIK
jgi:predicted nucleic acid-binding protein